MGHATAAQVATYLGRTFTAAQTAQASDLLADVANMILRRIPNIEALAGADAALDAARQRIEKTAVARVMRNPDGKLTERIDDYSWTRDGSTASGMLYISDDEWKEILPTASASAAAFSTTPFFEAGVAGDSLKPWAPGQHLDWS